MEQRKVLVQKRSKLKSEQHSLEHVLSPLNQLTLRCVSGTPRSLNIAIGVIRNSSEFSFLGRWLVVLSRQ